MCTSQRTEYHDSLIVSIYSNKMLVKMVSVCKDKDVEKVCKSY